MTRVLISMKWVQIGYKSQTHQITKSRPRQQSLQEEIIFNKQKMKDVKMTGQEEEDQVIFECDVILSHLIPQQDYACIQYPMRPNYRPYGDHGQKNTMLQYDQSLSDLRIAYSLDQNSANYDSSTMNNKVETHTLISSQIQPQTNDCLGFFKDSKLIITPLTKVFSMRTQLEHVDQQSKARMIAKPEQARIKREEKVEEPPVKREEYKIEEGSYSDLISCEQFNSLENLVSQKEFIEMLCQNQNEAHSKEAKALSKIDRAFVCCIVLPFSRVCKILEKEGHSQPQIEEYIRTECEYIHEIGKLIKRADNNSRLKLGRMIVDLFKQEEALSKQELYEQLKGSAVEELQNLIKIMCSKTNEGLLELRGLSSAQKEKEEEKIQVQLGDQFLN